MHNTQPPLTVIGTGTMKFFISSPLSLITTLSLISSFSKILLARAFQSTSFLGIRHRASRMSSAASSCLASNANPLLESWTANPFSMPPFTKIQTHHYKPALEEGMAEHLKDLQDIVNSPDPPTFENTLAAYDRAGSLLDRVQGVFGNMCLSKNPPELQEVQTEMSPILSRHSSETYMLPGLFDKIQTVFETRNESGLTKEQIRLVERIHLDFTRAGAHFDEEKQKRYTEIKTELASLTTQFMQNVLKDEETYELVLKRDDLTGCPDSLVEAAKGAAEERNKEDDEYVITLSRSLVEPFLTFSDRRDLRKIAFEAWTTRGEMSPERDNLAIAVKILKLRREQAKLHGYSNFAEYQCVDRMAKTPQAVTELLENVWGKAKASANREREALEEYVKESGEDLEGGIQAWDWRYCAEKVRRAKYDFDESLLKPYLSLESVTEAAFAVSNKLFGLRYIPRPDIPTYHEDVKTYEVRDTNDKLIAVFVHDNYARAQKNGGAWMSEYRSQTKNLRADADEVNNIPIVCNNNNFAKGSKTLLSFDDATTLFHEFGHGHHGMLSDCTYSRLASTNVLTDFVELPSQLMEHWFEEPQILKEYARHFETKEPVPEQLLDKFKEARLFNEGFATIEYTACALLDMLLHELEDYDDDFDVSKFEKEQLDRLGMPQGIVMRHRPAHFLHLFASSHYAAGYYVYLWAEVLDADAYAAFEETGNIFDPATASRVKEFIYSSGNTDSPDELFRKFRGRDPKIEFMLQKKGLVVA